LIPISAPLIRKKLSEKSSTFAGEVHCCVVWKLDNRDKVILAKAEKEAVHLSTSGLNKRTSSRFPILWIVHHSFDGLRGIAALKHVMVHWDLTP
jgi:hypothetical protein